MKNLVKLGVMVLVLILLVMTLVSEMDAHYQLTDMSTMLIVMATVSIVPALGKPFYVWMEAENAPDDEREELSAHRTKIMLAVSVILILLLATRFFMNIGLIP